MELILLGQSIVLEENFNLGRHLGCDILACHSQRNPNDSKSKRCQSGISSIR